MVQLIVVVQQAVALHARPPTGGTRTPCVRPAGCRTRLATMSVSTSRSRRVMRATMPGGSRSRQRMPTYTARSSYSSCTSVRSLGGWPSRGNACTKRSSTGAAAQAASSSRPSITGGAPGPRRPGHLVRVAQLDGRRGGPGPGPWPAMATKQQGRGQQPAKLHERDSLEATRASNATGAAIFPRPCPLPPARPGRFGQFGGRYVSETLMPSLDQLTAAWEEAQPRSGVQGRAGTPAARLRRPPDAAGRGPPAGGRGQPGGGPRRAPVPQARGPVPHRRAQDQQLHRPGAARPAHGQDADHRRDRRRPARRGHRHRLRAVRAALRGLHGRGGRRAPGAQRVPHEAARRQGAPGDAAAPPR